MIGNILMQRIILIIIPSSLSFLGSSRFTDFNPGQYSKVGRMQCRCGFCQSSLHLLQRDKLQYLCVTLVLSNSIKTKRHKALAKTGN